MNKLPLDPVDENTWAIARIVRFCAGDVDAGDAGEAFNELYGKFNPRVLRFLWAHLARKEDRWDVSQNVWMRIFLHSHRNFDLGGQFLAWLFHQTRSELSGWLRKNRRNFADIDEVSEDKIQAPNDNEGDRVLERIEAKEQLWPALKKLKPAHREILVLRFFDGMNPEECAKVLNVPVGTVYSRQNAAVRSLRENLGQ